jgi:hypothetical protein
MVVKKPLNINDEDLIDGMSRIEQPLSQPTAMSYSLQRIRLSEISRSIVDRSPLIMAHAGGPSYDVVMDIDTELQLLINDIPPFFSMSIANLTETYRLDPSRASNIVHQGYMFCSLLYAQRCKLHFPYFSRGCVDSAYASSREICLRSARLIIQTESQLENSGLCTATRYNFIGLLLGVFMASIVLLMDLCHNKSSPQQEKQRGEIADAFRILEEARHKSKTATKFLDSLMHVLHKHKVLVVSSFRQHRVEQWLTTPPPPSHVANLLWCQYPWLHQACWEVMRPVAPIWPVIDLQTGRICRRTSMSWLKALNRESTLAALTGTISFQGSTPRSAEVSLTDHHAKST